jgi:6-phosphogluconolactonase
MEKFNWLASAKTFDERRLYVIPGNAEETITYSANQFIQLGQSAIKERGKFYVALSGGSTPHAIYKKLSDPAYRHLLDWNQVVCFWSDERSVSPKDKESNFFNAMQSGLSLLAIPSDHIFRMQAEQEIEKNALDYESLIQKHVPQAVFDLMMLGMGEDGHTASLFPHTHGLHATDRLVTANYVPQQNTWRMSLTYDCIQRARQTCIYITGPKKQEIVAQVLLGSYEPDLYPVQKIGTINHPALWIMDEAASRLALQKLNSDEKS